MAEIKADKTIYETLQQDVRLPISKATLKKSGFNPHLNYAYYELGDFQPLATELFAKAGLCPVYSIGYDSNGIEMATIVLVKGPEHITFSIPTAEVPNMKGVFELGSKDTYCLRYLLARHVLMLPEADASEASNDGGGSIEEKKATEKQIELIQSLYDAENIVKMLDYYGVEKLSDMSLKQASEVIARKKK